MPNIKDVAKLAGVTPTTVSRILNNRGYISEKTREKVYAAMAELNYQPNQIARALLSHRSGLFAMIVPDSMNPFFSELVTHVEHAARKNGYRLILCNSFESPGTELNYLRILQGQNIDGLIVCSHMLDLSAYERLPFPIVSFDKIINPLIPLVASDNFYGGTLAARHLYEKNCKKLLVISGPLSDMTLLGHDRYRGFVDFCTGHDLYYEVETTEKNLSYEYFTDFVRERVGRRLTEFDGVFCTNDLLAFAVVDAASSTGIDVPAKLKVVGFDDSMLARSFFRPRLTTVAQDIPGIADALIAYLLEMQCAKPEKLLNIFGVRLVEGATT